MADFSYQNQSDSMVVLRCIGSKGFYLERVLFPLESILFEAPEESKVEVWGNELYGPRLEERIRVSPEKEDLPIAS